MDRWTRTSLEAQDHLFRRIDDHGNYTPHQAICGFAPNRLLQYCESYLLLSILDKLHFGNFIDIGCAEGFYPRLIAARYGVESYGVDLSVSGICRMREYHRLEGVCADAHSLPIRDNSFDLVLCSNTIEHVTHPKEVIAELLRISRRYVFIGVPQALTKKEIDEFAPDFDAQRDQHVHIYTTSMFGEILPESYSVTIHYAGSLPVLLLSALYKRTIGRLSHCLPLVKALLHIDRLSCKLFPRWTIHMLAQIDLTDSSYSTQVKRSSIADFILEGIYEINRDELEPDALSLGADDSQKWREYTVKSSEQSSLVEIPVSDRVLSFLICPHCKGDVDLEDNALVCRNCGAIYAVQNGIPVMHDLYKEEETEN